MTLVGLLPPLCDNGSMLVDGGYVDNLPVYIFKAINCATYRFFFLGRYNVCNGR